MNWLINFFRKLFGLNSLPTPTPVIPAPVASSTPSTPPAAPIVATPPSVVVPPAAPVPATPEQLHGFDCSDYQPTINWAAAIQGGNRFAWIKASEGITWKSQYFRSHLQQARAAGMLVGAYHFFEPLDDPQQQFNNFMSMYTPQAGDLCPFIDVEPTQGLKEIGATGEKNLLALGELFQKQFGMPPVIYYDFYFINFSYPKNFSSWVPFNAAYGAAPLIGAPWAKTVRPLFWQYTDTGNVAGIGQMDCDWFYGTEAQLQALRLK